jgi:hypothetical protein
MDPSIALQSAKFMFVVTINDFLMSCSLNVLSQELRYQVKPRSTTWFSKFLFTKYENDQWVENFMMLKSTLFQIADRLSSTLLKKTQSP